MRVAVVTHQFFPAYYTGVERLSLNLTAQLRRMGHDAVVVTSAQHSSGSTEPYAVEGTRVRPVHAFGTDLARPWLQPERVRECLVRVLDEEGAEVVHVMQPMRLPSAFAAADRLGLASVAHVADFGYLCARINLVRADGSLCTNAARGEACATVCKIPAAHDRFAWAETTLARAGAVVSPCRFTIDVFASQGFDTGGWHYIPWGTDYGIHAERLSAPGGEGLTIGFLGTLLPAKGPHVLVDALRLLTGANVRLELYGDSFHEHAYESDLRRRAAADRRIAFKGRYEHRELPRVLAGLDAVAIPSLWHENLPTVGLNAIAAGVPLLVSNVGGLLELIDDFESGFAFRAGDTDALANLLERLLEDPALLAGARARMRYPPSLEEEAWRMESVYAQVVAAKNAA